MLEYVEARLLEAPLDWLLHEWVVAQGVRSFVHVPSLFQHVGSRSTKPGRAAMHFDPAIRL